MSCDIFADDFCLEEELRKLDGQSSTDCSGIDMHGSTTTVTHSRNDFSIQSSCEISTEFSSSDAKERALGVSSLGEKRANFWRSGFPISGRNVNGGMLKNLKMLFERYLKLTSLAVLPPVQFALVTSMHLKEIDRSRKVQDSPST